MPAEKPDSFSQILASLDFQQDEAPSNKTTGNTGKFPVPEDSLKLSVQAKNILVTHPPAPSLSMTGEQENIRPQTDIQGNSVQISAQGNDLAFKTVDNVAWETGSATRLKGIP